MKALNLSQNKTDILKFVTSKLDVTDLLESGDVYLAGGAPRDSVTQMEAPNDWDFFFKTKDAASEFKARMDIIPGMDVIFKCPQGLLESRKIPMLNSAIKVQAIMPRYYDSPETLLDQFDFTCTQWHWNGQNVEVFSSKVVRDTLSKTLRLHKLTAPVSTIRRLHKYRDRGYNSVNATEDLVATLITSSPENLDDFDMRWYID